MGNEHEPTPNEVPALSDLLGRVARTEFVAWYNEWTKDSPSWYYDAEVRAACRLAWQAATARAAIGPAPARSEMCQPDGLRFDAVGAPRERYVRITLNGSHCVMHPSEGDCYVEDARNAGDPDWERYIVRDVWLSEREFDDLPEHNGF